MTPTAIPTVRQRELAAQPVAGLHPGWLQMPDWFSFDNEGGNVAVADLTGTGTSSLR
jgi:hypothetical protein